MFLAGSETGADLGKAIMARIGRGYLATVLVLWFCWVYILIVMGRQPAAGAALISTAVTYAMWATYRRARAGILVQQTEYAPSGGWMSARFGADWFEIHSPTHRTRHSHASISAVKVTAESRS